MNQEGLSDLNKLLEGIATKIGEFTEAIKGSSKQLDSFSKTIDDKIVSLNDSISSLTTVIKEEDEKLSKNLRSLMDEVKGEIKGFKDEVNVSELKDTLTALQKLVKIPEKNVINKTVDKVMKEVHDIVQEIKGAK